MLDLITAPYGVEPAMVVEGQSGLNSDKFDGIAKALTTAATEEILQAMLKTLLADRFKLLARQDTKEMPVYVLTVGKNGSKLRPAANSGPPKTSRGEGDPTTTSSANRSPWRT